MATIKFNGLEGYIAKLDMLGRQVESIFGKAIYEGAKIVADEERSRIEALQTSQNPKYPDWPWWGTPKHLSRGPSPMQVQGLLESFGVSHMQTDEHYFTNVRLGFYGRNYFDQPNALIARAINSGTSFMEAQPFIKQTVQATRKEAVKAMKETAEQEIARIMETQAIMQKYMKEFNLK